MAQVESYGNEFDIWPSYGRGIYEITIRTKEEGYQFIIEIDKFKELLKELGYEQR